jgi:hypothetical protein
VSDQTLIAVLAQTDGWCSVCLGEYRRGVSVLAPTADGSMAHYRCVYGSDEDGEA